MNSRLQMLIDAQIKCPEYISFPVGMDIDRKTHEMHIVCADTKSIYHYDIKKNKFDEKNIISLHEENINPRGLFFNNLLDESAKEIYVGNAGNEDKYLSEKTNRVFVYSLNKVGEYEFNEEKSLIFQDPNFYLKGLCCSLKRMYVVDYFSAKILVYKRDTHLHEHDEEFYMGGMGGEGASGMWSDGSYLYIGNTELSAINVFSIAHKEFVKSYFLNIHRGNTVPTDISLVDNRLYVLDFIDNTIYVYNFIIPMMHQELTEDDIEDIYFD